MKKILFPVFIAAAAFSLAACDNDNANEPVESSVLLTRLPETAQQVIKSAFINGTVQEVSTDLDPTAMARGSAYEATIRQNGVALDIEFDAQGLWTDIEAEDDAAIPAAILNALPQLPAALLTYVKTNHAGTGITEIERKAYGFHVELQQDIELLFDKEGVILSQTPANDSSTATPQNVPGTVTEFVSKYFAGYSVVRMKSDKEDGLAVTKYYLQKGYNESYKLVYDSAGQLIEVEGDDEPALPVGAEVVSYFSPAVNTYVTAHYAHYYVVEISKEAATYAVEIQHKTNPELDYTLYFDHSGGFLRQYS